MILLLWKSRVRLTNLDPGGCAESLNLFFHHYHHLSPAAGRPVRNNRISFIRLAGDINHLCTHWPPPQMMRWHQHRETIQSLLVPTSVDCSRIPSGLSILLCTELRNPWPGPPYISLRPIERTKIVLDILWTLRWVRYVVFEAWRLQQDTMPDCIYNSIMAMGFSAMFTFQLDNTKR